MKNPKSAQLIQFIDSLQLRWFFLATLGLALLGSLLEVVVFRSGLVAALANCFTTLLEVWIGAAFCAMILAIPGWLFRGHYRFKTLFLIFSAGAIVSSVAVALSPLQAKSSLMVPVALLCAVIYVLSSFLGLFGFLISLVKESALDKTARVCLIIAAVGASSGLTHLFSSQGHDDAIRQLFTSTNTSLVKMLSGPSIETSEIGDGLASYASTIEESTQPVASLWRPTAIEQPPITDHVAPILTQQPPLATGQPRNPAGL